MKAGQHVSADPGDFVHDTEHDRGGEVAQSGRWWPYSWWDGHWLKRTRCGEWRDKDGAREVCHRRHGHAGEHAHYRPAIERARTVAVPDDLLYPSDVDGSKRGRRRHERQRVAGDYRAYLEARYDDAEQDARGNLVSAAGRARGIKARQFFSGRRVSLRYASDELKDWFAANGRNLTASDYRRQAVGGGVYEHVGVPV